MDTWNAKYRNKWNEFEVKFCSDDYEKAKAVERVCQYIMDGEITSRSDVATVRRGHWVRVGNGTTCSECMQGLLRINGKQSEWVDLSGMPYCPNCGAKMEVSNDD